MQSKFLIFLALTAFVAANPVQINAYSAAAHHHIPLYKKAIDDGPAEYEFTYGVHDEHTKDIKMQKESRKGDLVQGSYELIDSDGFKRIVDYTADDKNGFQALVHREKTNIVVPIPEQKLHKVDVPYHSYQQPTVHQQYVPTVHNSYVPPAPAKYLAPVVQKSYVSQPAVKYVAKQQSLYNYDDKHVGTHVTFHGSAASYQY